MLELEDALNRILSEVKPLPSESIPLADSGGRIAAEPLFSSIDLPVFDNSAMDGYAVLADDLKQASKDHPTPLELVGGIAAGDTSQTALSPGTCIRIFTGSPLPEKADAVVMQEDTIADKSNPNVIHFLDTITPWEHVRFRGEDVKKGSQLIDRGERITLGHLALLGGVGIADLSVGGIPKVGIVSTGNELQEAGEPLEPGKIFESNRLILAELTRQSGAEPRVYPLVRDSLPETISTLRSALDDCDVVITTGGVSVGDLDFVRPAIEEIGGNLEFWRVRIKPGKPFVFGTCNQKVIFGLPGNPVSSVVTFVTLVRAALLKIQGATDLAPTTVPGRLAQPLVNSGDRRHFFRVRIEKSGDVHSTGAQVSHALSSLSKSNGLVDVSPNTTLPEGANVSVIMWGR